MAIDSELSSILPIPPKDTKNGQPMRVGRFYFCTQASQVFSSQLQQLRFSVTLRASFIYWIFVSDCGN